MQSSIFLVTGWGVGATPLTPLADELASLGYQTNLVDLPYLTDPQDWLPVLAEQLPTKSYWLGWSLGGQLLSQLTLTHAMQCLGLITLASNVCFKANNSWLTAMPADIFTNFQQSYQRSPEQTIKRFLQLVAQGSPEPKQLVRQLQQASKNYTPEQANAGLELLATLDTRLALQRYQGAQYHLLAELDGLVPKSCYTALSNLLNNAKVELVEQTGHGLPLQCYQLVASKIHQFIKDNHERCY